MNTLQPVSVALKFGFLAVLYLFLLWVVRSARRDLGAGARMEAAQDPRFAAPFASARHALIYDQGNSVVIEDLGSTNGTYLNEELLQTPRPLHPGDRVRIGESEFAFEAD